MFSKRFFQALTFVCATAMLLSWGPTPTEARVIANDLSANAVAVYYFDAQNNGFVTDYGTNRLTGGLFNNARIQNISGRRGLSLSTNAAEFAAWDGSRSLSVNREFSIVAWVKVPLQATNFIIDVWAYNIPFLDIWEIFENHSGNVYLSINADNTMSGVYIDHAQPSWVDAVGGNVSNNRWQHVGFVVNTTSMRLYLNGNRVANQPVNGHSAFRGIGTGIMIGHLARGVVDDVGYFRNDFTDAQVKLIYTAGLKNIISIAAVDPNAKAATTWGSLKHQ